MWSSVFLKFDQIRANLRRLHVLLYITRGQTVFFRNKLHFERRRLEGCLTIGSLRSHFREIIFPCSDVVNE